MIKTAIATVSALGLFLSVAAYSSSVPVEALTQGTAHDALFAVAFDGNNGIATGAPGRVLNSSDGGKTWINDKSFPVPLALLGADLKGGKAVVVGQMGLAYTRDEKGAWKKSDTGTTERLMNVSLNTHGLAVAVGSFGTVLKSTDAGASWASVAPDWNTYADEEQKAQGIQPHMSAVNVAEDGTITIAGEFSLILRSNDGGASWKQLNKGAASIFALELRGDNVGYAVGQDGTILRSSDGGASWTAAIASGAGKPILLGVHSSGSTVVVAGMHDMLISKDDGKTWDHVVNEDVSTAWYSGVAASSGGIVAVGHGGRIIHVGA
jgi:photosystem II stability/assembly factor-like uncharacterized protein